MLLICLIDFVFVSFYLKVMCFLEHLQVEFTIQVSLKAGLETSGGMGAPLFLLSQLFVYLLHWHALSESVSVIPCL
jgi:hypothetical protein